MEASGTSDAKIGVVTDVGTLDDKNFNEYSWIGTQQGAASIGAPSPQAIVTANSADYATNIQTLIDDQNGKFKTAGKPYVPVIGADNNEFLKQLKTLYPKFQGAAVTNPPRSAASAPPSRSRCSTAAPRRSGRS